MTVGAGAYPKARSRPKGSEPTQRPGADLKAWSRPKGLEPTQRIGANPKARAEPKVTLQLKLQLKLQLQPTVNGLFPSMKMFFCLLSVKCLELPQALGLPSHPPNGPGMTLLQCTALKPLFEEHKI